MGATQLLVVVVPTQHPALFKSERLRLSPKAMSLQQMKPQVRECGASMLSMVRNTAARRI